uniref:Uncharacterized protein n=1 Tax=Arundo donax TaxID=35708 RepID=A0A0A9EUP4_ARUDO
MIKGSKDDRTEYRADRLHLGDRTVGREASELWLVLFPLFHKSKSKSANCDGSKGNG